MPTLLPALLASLIAVAIAATVAALPAAASCPLDLYRKHDPTWPPRILVEPPVGQAAGPAWVDPDPAPGGTPRVVSRMANGAVAAA